MHRRLLVVVIAMLAFAGFGLGVASAAPQSRTWVQDFEQSTADWIDLAPGTIHRVPSGYVSPSSYASGIASAHGNWHARLRTSGCETMRFTTFCTGPFTRFGKAASSNATFPAGGYMTEVDIYLDVGWAAGKMDYRFDWSSAINDNTGGHRRDFIFNVGTPLTLPEAIAAPGYYVNASTNGNRSGAFPQNTCPNPGVTSPPNYCRAPVKITQSGWYTFRHEFYTRHHEGTDYLAVDFTVLRHDGVVMGNWWLSSVGSVPSDTIATIGGDRYGWFVINEINDLAIDCSNLRPRAIGHPPLQAQCFDAGDGDGDDGGDGDDDGGDDDDDDDDGGGDG